MASTGQNLVDGARKRAGYQNTGFVTDTEVLVWVNDERREVYDIINQQDESVYSTSYAFTLPDTVLAAAYTAASLGTPPDNYAALPSDLDRIQGVDYVPASGSAQNRTLHMFSFQERNAGKWTYRAHGRIASTEILQLSPVDNAAGNYLLWYIPRLTDLTLSTSLDAIQQKFSDLIEVGAAIRILIKAKRDVNALEGQRQDLRRRLITMSNNRDSEAEQGGTSQDGHYTRGWPFDGRTWWR